jgi:UPF0716 protein FxsA
VLSRLFVLFVLVPLADLALLAWIGSHATWLIPLCLVSGSGLIGFWLLKQQGSAMLSRGRGQASLGRPPADPLDRMLMIVAGILLIIPGIVTDLAAVAILLPRSRAVVKRHVRAWFKQRVTFAFAPGAADRTRPADQIIDVRVVESGQR